MKVIFLSVFVLHICRTDSKENTVLMYATCHPVKPTDVLLTVFV